jgi:hypothetical protein
MEKFREISSVKRNLNFDFERLTSNDFAELQKNSEVKARHCQSGTCNIIKYNGY